MSLIVNGNVCIVCCDLAFLYKYFNIFNAVLVRVWPKRVTLFQNVVCIRNEF